MATIAPPVRASASLPASVLGIAKRGLLKFLRTPSWWSSGPSRGPCSC
jgi:hypothetical protein